MVPYHIYFEIHKFIGNEFIFMSICECPKKPVECVLGGKNSGRIFWLVDRCCLYLNLRPGNKGKIFAFQLKYIGDLRPGDVFLDSHPILIGKRHYFTRTMGIQYCIDNHYMVVKSCLLYTSPSPRDKRQSRMPSSA